MGEKDEAYLRLKRASFFHRLNKRAHQKDCDAMEAGLVQRTFARMSKWAKTAFMAKIASMARIAIMAKTVGKTKVAKVAKISELEKKLSRAM